MTRACFEHYWTDGVKAERARCEALLKLLQPETRELVLAAIADGRSVQDILDQTIAAIQNPAKGRASDWRPGSTEKAEALASALSKRRPRHSRTTVNGSKE